MLCVITDLVFLSLPAWTRVSMQVPLFVSVAVNQQPQMQHVAANEMIDMKIATSMTQKDESKSKRKETEYEERKHTKIDLKNKTRDEKITMNFVATGASGEKFSESATYTTTTPIGQNELCRTEMRLPIKKEKDSPVSFTDDVMLVSEIASAETAAFKNCEK